jgi:hypothetical protein
MYRAVDHDDGEKHAEEAAIRRERIIRTGE